MDQAKEAAREINQRWHECEALHGVVPAGCPTDDEVAAIIRNHFPEEK